ncbi:MAG: nuclear transport factor 2 family protein [Rhodovulum sulfidophilum]|uniref:Nuclear transport factor 2 family protein n=1 Tax=Rhodovulum sulfidophilum TaxID=35806 RepID=A0A2W5MYL3_RHOSU|nr:MAG: nuclear transport factor 2 family protein [Rhodovulum sulfidophilum]
MEAIERRLRALEDHQQIAQLRARYCHVLDDRDWPALAALFTEDGEFHGLASAIGRAGILAFFGGTVDRLAEGFWHFCSNPTVDLAGDTATGRISMQYLSVKQGVSYVSAGHYDDVFRREGGVWRFARRRITFYYYAPLSEGFVGAPTYITPEGVPLPGRAPERAEAAL